MKREKDNKQIIHNGRKYLKLGCVNHILIKDKVARLHLGMSGGGLEILRKDYADYTGLTMEELLKLEHYRKEKLIC